MPTVGPTLPPHLQKRKRSPSYPEDCSSPPAKIRAANPPQILGPAPPPAKNPDELDLRDSSEDEYGPSIQAPNSNSRPAKRVLGPAAPPPSRTNPDELDVQDSSEDDSSTHRSKEALLPSPAPAKAILGPAPPPASLSEMPSYAPDSDSASDSDHGPALPPAPGSAAAALLQQRAERDQERARGEARAEASKPQRAEWMLAPPTDSDWTSRVDPTKLKNRKFASGKGAQAPAEKSGVSAIWTEMPEEKRRTIGRRGTGPYGQVLVDLSVQGEGERERGSRGGRDRSTDQGIQRAESEQGLNG